MTIDEKAVQEYYKTHSIKETYTHFGISRQKLYGIIGYPSLRRPWLDPEQFKADLKRFKNNVPLLAKYYGITPHAIWHRRRALKLKRKQNPWSKREDNYLFMNYFQVTREEMQKKLGRTWRAIHTRATNLGLRRKSALGYTQADVARDLGLINHTNIVHWEKRLNFPVSILESGERSYSEADIYDWLESGHILRLNPDRVRPPYKQLFDTVKERFICRDELLEYGFNPTQKRHILTLSPLMIDAKNGTGSWYPRDVIFEYIIPFAPRLFAPKPHQIWLQRVFAEYRARYITTAAIKAAIPGSVGNYYYEGFPRPVCVGSYDRAAVVAWCAQHRRGAIIMERIHTFEGNPNHE